MQLERKQDWIGCLLEMSAHRRRRFRFRFRITALSTGTRLGLTFVVVLGLFAFALIATLDAMTQLERADREDAELDQAKHAGHRVATLLREQYIHQAHTIIESNRTHISHYNDVAEITRTAAAQLANFARSAEEKLLAKEIAELVQKNHDDFMNTTLPAIDRGDREEILVLHQEMEKLIISASKKIRALNASFESRSDAAHVLADRERNKVRRTLLLCFGAATLFASIVAIITTRWIGYRVGRLKEGVRRFGHEGDLSRRLAIEEGEADGAGSDDELSGLAVAFNEMAESLSRHQRELVQAQKLASMGRLCAGVAHEINGPLGIILGYASVLRKQGRGGSAVVNMAAADDEALKAIEEEAQQCRRIVQALLDMSPRQEAPPRFATVDLAQLARDSVDRLRATEKVGDRQIDIRTPAAADNDDRDVSVEAYGDEAKLRQVLLNLVSNAVEATTNDGSLTIQVAERDGCALFVVEDNGCGLSSSYVADHLFEPFATTKAGGTGLGLAISRAIVEAHRGNIVVGPRAGGGPGTRVEVTLDLARDHRHEIIIATEERTHTLT